MSSISPLGYVGLFVLLFIGAIFAAKAIGVWQSVPGLDISGADGELNPDLIKGWMTMEDVSKASGISLNILAQNCGVSLKDSNIPLKELKNYYPGFETSIVRGYIENYNSLSKKSEPDCPWAIENDSYPGDGGIYVDADKNSICDYSE